MASGREGRRGKKVDVNITLIKHQGGKKNILNRGRGGEEKEKGY